MRPSSVDGARASAIWSARIEARRAARAARDFAEARLNGRTVLLRDIRFGKYAGRVVARVELAAGDDFAGDDFAGDLIAAGLARAYGGGARNSWCAHARPD